MKFLSTFKELYRHSPLQGKIFYVLVTTSSMFSMINAILNLILGLHRATVIIAIITAIICNVLFIYTVRSKTYIRPAQVTFIILLTIIYPGLWFTNGGSHGPTPYFLIFNVLLIAIMMKRKTAIMLFIYQMLVTAVLVLVELLKPSMIIGYDSRISQILDLSISIMLIGCFIFIILQRIMTEYNARIEELHRIQAKYHKLSITDALTGVYNRRHIIETLHTVVEGSNAFSLIMLDIDDFKTINDNYGHHIGDEVIIGVSHLLEANVRPGDIVGRIGGEEFLILLNDTEVSDAHHRAEIIRQQISDMHWTIPSLTVTVSGGVYNKVDHDHVNDILEKVDSYLYKAKKSGKNKIHKKNG